MKIYTLLSCAAAVAVPSVSGAVNSPFISKVHEFLPAPGQFVHSVPPITDDMTREQVLAEVERQLVGDERPGMVSLGAFGGYVIFSFDHPVVNVAGQYDFKIYGNSFKNTQDDGCSSEPGIVMVSVDANGNGLPDDEWFELRGSESDNPETIRNFTITYRRPSQTEKAEDISWTSDSESYPEGVIAINQFHQQSYWPAWTAKDETLTFTGTRLPNNGHNEGSATTEYWVLDSFDWGYADNLPDFVNDPETGSFMPNPENPGFDISNAVDANGVSVTLGHVDFIKVYTAMNQMCGWLGETSTEVEGARDLHPDAVESGLAETIADSAASVRLSDTDLMVSVEKPSVVEIYDASGRQAARYVVAAGHNTLSLASLNGGIYIVRVGDTLSRIAL